MRSDRTLFKKLIFTGWFICLVFVGFSQEDYKRFRFGLQVTPSLNWYKSSNPKKIQRDGLKLRFGWGMLADYHFNETTALSLGIQLDYHGGALRYKDDVLYFYSQDKITELKDIGAFRFAGDTMQLYERVYNITYITLPVAIKMKTKEIGYLTYFGNFGINTSIKTKATANDNVIAWKNGQPSGNEVKIEDVDISQDVKPLRFQVNIGVGAEYNLTGSTSLTVNLKYNYGLSSVLNGFFKKESKYMFQKDSFSAGSLPLKQKALENNISLIVGVLF